MDIKDRYQCINCKEWKSLRVFTKCNDCVDKELETIRLADIGRATEKFLEKESVLYQVEFSYDDFSCSQMQTVEELLEWAKGGK